ncbi:MAG TPA: hypothetical protein VGS58_07025, partial [Candidatus Sulfopaludibacter sp.]|nr:hypothetical protein [Candidatus Sulfopaludibacter sp.]
MTPASADWLEVLAGMDAEEAGYAAFFAAHAELREPHTVERLHDEVLRILYADLDRARRLARAACALAGDLDDPACRASGLRAMGHVNYAGSHYEEAVRDYQRALEIFSG